MNKTIAIIDYGMGNLKSVARAFERVGASIVVTDEAAKIRSADKIVLPGVGSFGHCMKNLKDKGLDQLVKDEIRQGKIFFGICLGLQVLFDSSAESADVKGLGLIRGTVQRFTTTALKVPHMGWNQVDYKSDRRIFASIGQGENFYFVHSYYVCPQDESVIAATADYGERFCAAVQVGNIYACQFHPEKSQQSGLQVIKNFCDLGPT